MPELEPVFLALTLLGLAFGLWGVVWARTSKIPNKVVYGWGIFMVTLFCLGITGLFAAVQTADGLVPLGLSAGFLVTGMLWELPAKQRAEAATVPVRD